jgi:hypothetical protein
MMSKIFLAAVAIAVSMTMASAPNAWGGMNFGKTFNGLNLANGINLANGLNLGNGISLGNGINVGNGTSHETLGSAVLIAVELQH